MGRLRRQRGLHSLQRRCWRISTTASEHSLPVVDNLLARQFTASAPDRVWLGDITDVRTVEGWLYLAGLNDLRSREILGYAMAERMTSELTLQALERVGRHRPRD